MTAQETTYISGLGADPFLLIDGLRLLVGLRKRLANLATNRLIRAKSFLTESGV